MKDTVLDSHLEGVLFENTPAYWIAVAKEATNKAHSGFRGALPPLEDIEKALGITQTQVTINTKG